MVKVVKFRRVVERQMVSGVRVQRRQGRHRHPQPGHRGVAIHDNCATSHRQNVAQNVFERVTIAVGTSS